MAFNERGQVALPDLEILFLSSFSFAPLRPILGSSIALRRRGRRFRWTVTTGHAPRLYDQSNLFGFSARPLLCQLSNNGLRGTGFIPNISRSQRFRQNKPRHLRRLRRVENFCFILGGNLFWSHFNW